MSLCPSCSSRNSKVLDTRIDERHGWLRRRRRCNECETLWATYEIPEQNVTVTHPEAEED